MVIELIGFVGSTSLALCAAPQAIHTIQTKDASGISWGFLWLWLIGEILLSIYQYSLNGINIIQLNYLLNTIIVLILMYYKGLK